MDTMECWPMQNLYSLSGGQAQELGDLQAVEQRVRQLEALVQEMRLEIEQLRKTVHPESQRRLEKMKAYQKHLDGMFGLQISC